MKRIMKVFVVMMVLLAFICVMGEKKDASAKVKRYKLTMGKNGTVLKTYAYRNAKSVKITVSKKGIVSAKRGGFAYANLQIRAKKAGKTTVKVKAALKSGKKQTYCYNVTVKGSATAREVFEEQNEVRKKAGAVPLEWSEELYQFAKYRVKASGLNRRENFSHENLDRDRKNYFGDRAVGNFGENLARGCSSWSVISLWKNSSGHYLNMVYKDFKSGAIYCVDDCWVAIFSKKTNEEIKKAIDTSETLKTKTIITRKDSETGMLLSDCQFTIAKVSDGSIVCSVGILSSKMEVSTTKLVPGETYKIYEVIPPDGYKKAKTVTFTVTEGTNYITMTD